MSSIQTKKEQIRKQILNAAKIYKQELMGKTFLYVYGNKYFEVIFMADSFLHLTGVASELSAKEFYYKSADETLTTDQFGFSKRHPLTVAKRKLPCLARLPELTTDYVCILKNQGTMTFVYKLSVTNLEFTLGLMECVDNIPTKNKDNMYIPRSLRIKDKAVEQSAGGEVVDFIFTKLATAEKYNILTLADSSKKIPEEIRNLIDSKFYI